MRRDICPTVFLDNACWEFFLFLGSYVFYFDGNVQCYKNVHLVMTIVASAVLLLVVVPLPIVVLLIVFGVLPVGPVITDALAQGLR